MIFETHAHYDDEQFAEDREARLDSMAEGGVGNIVNVSATYDSCERVVNMVQKYPFMYAAVGIHPDEVGSLNEESFESMKTLFQRDKVVGEGKESSSIDSQSGSGSRYDGNYEELRKWT